MGILSTIKDYKREIYFNISFQAPQVNRVIEKGNSIVNKIEDIFKELKGNHKMPTLREAIDELPKAIIEYRNSVPQDLVVNTILFSRDNSGKVNKSTEWGNKKLLVLLKYP